MKKTLLFLSFFFCVFSFTTKAQLTLTGTGGTYWDTNGFNNNYAASSAAIIALPSPNVIDAGTNVYSHTVNFPLRDHKFIVRMNNYWYIGEHAPIGSNNPTVYLLLSYKHKFFSTSINPPCDSMWEKLTAPDQGTFLNLILAGNTCFQVTSINGSTLFPNYLQIPVQTATQIAAIQNPGVGMIVWDSTNQCLKLYNGTAWVCMF